MIKIIAQSFRISGIRCKFIRKLLNISRESDELKAAAGISSRQIQAIEKGQATTAPDIHKYGYLMGLDPIKLYQKDFHFPEEATLRQNLKDYYSNIGFELEQDFLNTTPTIATGILHRLIPGGHLDNPIGVGNIIEIAKTDYKLVMEGSSLSNELKKLTESKDILIKDTRASSLEYYKNPKLSDIDYLRRRQVYHLLRDKNGDMDELINKALFSGKED